MTLKSQAKFDEKRTCGLEKEKFDKFLTQHLKASELVFSSDSFFQSRK